MELEYNILDGDVQSKIYEMAGGYPIITYYLAEEYKQTNKMPERQLIAGVNEYYDSLFINGDSISFSISVFAVGNCFLQKKPKLIASISTDSSIRTSGIQNDSHSWIS